MKKNKLYRIVILSLILCFVFISTINAVTFTDLPEDWSKDYITKAAELGFVKGFNDGTFGPDKNVTRFDSVLMLSRLHKINTDLEKQIENKYSPSLKELMLGKNEWAYPELSKAIALNIISESVVKKLYSNNTLQVSATREDVAVFIVKAMCLENEVEQLSEKLYSLAFNDANQITTDYRPYVYLAYEKGIISGDQNKNFNPKNPIKRKELAKMVCLAYDYIQSNNIKPEFNEFQSYTTIKGSIEKITLGAIESYLEIKPDGSDTTQMVRVINESTVIKVNKTVSNIANLEKGMAVQCIINSKDSIAKEIVVDTTISTVEGTIKYVAFSPPMKLTITKKDGVDQIYNINTDVVVTIDGKITEFKNLKKDDLVSIKLVDNVVTQINSTSKVQVKTGKIKNIEYNIPIILTLEDSTGKLYTYTYVTEPAVTRNSVATSFDQLRVGDEATIKTEYDVLSAIDAKSVVSTADITATIKEITIGANNRIKLESSDGEIKDYIISKTARITVLNASSSIYDLRVGYAVKVNLDGTEIISIEVEGTGKSIEQTGKIIYVYNASNLNMEKNVIILQIKNSLNETENIYLKLNPDSVIMTLTGIKLRISDLKQGMDVLCLGTYSNGGTFDTISIIIK